MRPGPSRWPRPDSPGPCADPYIKPVTPSANCTLGTNPGRTYRFYTGEAVVPFGFGLSYTTWSYALHAAPRRVSLARVRALLAQTTFRMRATSSTTSSTASTTASTTASSPATAFPRLADDAPAFQYAVNVTNTGSMDADDVVLGFLTPPGAGTGGLPLKTLFGFERVHVKAGKTVTVYLAPTLSDFAPVMRDGERRALPGVYRISVGLAETAHLGMGFLASEVLAFG